MKKILKFSLILTLIISFNSCSEGDVVIDSVLDNTTSGAVLRTITPATNQFAIGTPDFENIGFSVEIEEQDNQNGALLDNVQVYVSFRDDSEGTTTNESLFTTVDASAFNTSTEFGLPRYTLNMTAGDMLGLSSVTEDDLFGGDIFFIRLVLNLTDGRSFSNDNAGPSITGGFFSSPFIYAVNVVCAIPEDYMQGAYLMERISDGEDPFFPNYGQAFTEAGQLVTIGGEGAERIFDFSFFPTSFDFAQVMTLTLSCGDILVRGTASSGTLGCGGGSIEQSTGEVPSTYALDNDAVIEIDFLDFEPDAGCGTGNYPVTIRLTKQ